MRFIYKDVTMRSQEIANINQAVFILRHFLDLSSELIPYLFELETKSKLTPLEREKKERIKAIYEAHRIDSNTSVLLINSNILELLNRSYHAIIYKVKSKNKKHLEQFLTEYERLKENWWLIEAN